MSADYRIRPAVAEDAAALRQLLLAAFEGLGEADLVDALQASDAELVSLVAETTDGQLIGQILFSSVSLTGGSHQQSLTCLAPMAVRPDWQRLGVGGGLVAAGLAACREAGFAGVFVLGHPGYYPRFGFEQASRFGVACEFPVPDEAWMAQPLIDDGLDGLSGSTLHFRPEFSLVT